MARGEQWAGRCRQRGLDVHRTGRRGAAMVEFAIVVPLLCLLVLGIMEFGMVMHDYIMVVQGAREGTRSAAVGDPVSKIKARVIEASALRDLTPGMVQVTWFDPNTGGWVAVTDAANGLSNAVPPDGIVRVIVNAYPHHMVTGNFFAWLPGYQNGSMMLSSRLTMRRE